ncbi:MAG: hypothetical protein K2U26_15345, partial [Cyclobacteriaceae bacterium]|nr:hypothetical protein [Cyclobacteriaceae bacterium]
MKIRLHTAPLLICLLAIVLICPQSSAAGTVDSLTEKSIIIHDLSTSNTRQFDDLAFPLNTDSDPIILNSPADDSIQYYRGRSQELKRVVLETQRFRETLDKMALVDLPIGIVGDKANANYAILIDKVFFNERGTFIEVYMSFEVPQMNKPLDFRGIVQITQEGGITGTARLYLLDNHEFDIGRGKLTINGDPRIRDGQNFTFVEFDCNGFKGLSLKATIEFSKDILVTETPTGEPKDERVKIALTTYLTSWSDLLLRVNIPDFQIKGVKGLGFKIDEAYFDWSDTASPPRFVAPADYQNPFVGSAQQNLWQGIYIKQAKIMFPPQFKEKGDPLRRSIGGEDLIIDQTGFSGRLFAENLIRSGDMTGWAFTLDRAEVQVVKNSLTQFAIRGRINIPAFEKSAQPADQREDASLAYSAFMTASGNYQFDVIFRERLELNLLAAELFINPNSSITIAKRDQKFIASANLNGQLNINAPFSGTSALLSKISFER